MSKSAPAAEYGKRLLPTVLDDLVKSEPNRTFAQIPECSFIAKGFKNITVSEVANGVNNMAHWINKNVGKPKTEFQTFAYLGIPDLRYPVVLLAAIKCGYKVLFPSVRNSVVMNTSLVEQTKCEIFLCPEAYEERFRALAKEIKSLNIETRRIPKFAELFYEPAQAFEYNKMFDEAMWDPVVVLHSSGSTGLPKCITLNNGALARVDSDRTVPDVAGREVYNFRSFDYPGEPGKHYLGFPPFHLSGLLFLTCVPIYYNSCMLLGPPDRPPSGQVINEILQTDSGLNGLIAPPSVLEQFATEPGSTEMAKKVSYVAYAGGPLAVFAGNLLSTVTNVRQFYGATECLFTETLVVDREDWEYLEFHPLFAAEFQEDVDNSYELVIHAHRGAPETRMLPYTLPGVDEWRTKDLFKKHPTKEHLWKYFGRKDDIIVLSNGEKMNPVPMENTIEGHPFVNGCIILGQGRFQSALLIEPTIPTNDADSVIEKIWPTVQEANAIAPAYARILRSMILVSPPDKPFPRTGKGTVLRKKTIDMLAKEIEGMYSAGDGRPGHVTAPEPAKQEQKPQKVKTEKATQQALKPQPAADAPSADSVKQMVRSALAHVFSGGNLHDQDDFYVSGLDSLSTIEVVDTLRKSLQQAHKDTDLCFLNTKAIYGNPTIDKLSTLIASSLHLDTPRLPSAVTKPSAAAAAGTDPRALKMANLVSKYTADLINPTLPHTPLTVLLTGSTGGVGSHLLHTLLNDPLITRIICLNRSPDAKSRHANGLFSGRDLSKATFLTAFFAHPLLGQKASTYWELMDSVDIIIHNAWKVDFNHTLESFEDVHLRGVRNFIDFSLKSLRKPHIYFVSSVSACTNVGEGGKVPEAVPERYESALNMGYGESKLVAERILQIAVAKAGVKASVLRLGQVAGPVDEAGLGGEWNKHEWFPALVKTSKTLGCIPMDLVDPDWVPIDRLADIIVEIIHNECNVSQVYNLVSPRVGNWAEMAKAMKRAFGKGVREVTLKEWVDMLERGGKEKADYEGKPALKILPFYKSMLDGKSAGLGKGALKYETVHGEAGSRRMAELQGVSGAWMDKWLKQWKF